MFKAIPHGEKAFRQRVGSEVDATGDLLALANDTELPPPEERPFVQLSYNEITGQELDRILGGDICAATCIVGLPGGTERALPGTDVLLVPLSNLANRLRTAEPQLAMEFDAHGTDAIMASREVTVAEYLVLGMLHCIAWCDTRRAALMISW